MLEALRWPLKLSLECGLHSKRSASFKVGVRRPNGTHGEWNPVDLEFHDTLSLRHAVQEWSTRVLPTKAKVRATPVSLRCNLAILPTVSA